ncbi:hypothetical protein M9Y10_007194 [Tritrichomonas musculus]|uniref:BTB domain-containing protein n=1 Tax=Tritrichomonas musculus TaxID=1915356 RepID=A0ABR2J387_9EUKA
MSDNENIQTLKPLYRQNKSIIFKGKEYPINFELFQCHSNYFYEFSKDFENDHDILIFEEFSDISEETFSQFVLACQSEKFSITISNIIELHHLSIEYDVPHLKNLTNDIIEEHRDELIFKIIKYKYSKIRNNENKEKDVKYSLDLKMEEEIIAIHFFEYIKQDEFYELPIEFIYRVMNSERMKKEMNEEEEDEFEEFLMKSLNIYGREASILFTKVNFNNTTKSIKFIQRIIQEYSELIDFHMINPIFIMKTSLGIFDKYSELSKEHERIKEENKGLLKKLEYQTNELSEYAIKEKEQSEEKIKLERNNKEQTKEIELLKNENNQLKEFLNEAKTKEYIFQKLVMTSKINEFNELPVKFQSVIVKEMKKLPDIEIDTLEVIEKIERLLLYLSMNDLEEESGIHLMNETSDEMKDVKTISRVTILSTCTKNLFNHKKLNTSEMKEIIEELPFVNFEMKYPSSSFESIYDETKDLKGTCRDKMCMTIFISNIDKTDLHFRNDKNITSIRLDDTVH